MHTALKGDEFVETESEGDEGQRRLIVRPSTSEYLIGLIAQLPALFD